MFGAGGVRLCRRLPADDAELMIADAIEPLVGRRGFRVTVSRGEGDDVWIEANDAGTLAAFALRRQREASGLSLAEVAAALGQSSRNSYEQARAVPTLDKFEQLLHAVAPEPAIVVRPRPPRRSR